MKKLVLAAVLFSLAIVSCKKKDSTSPAAVLIRIKNNSTANLSYAAISNKKYGGINAGMVTDYKAFDRVIAYAGAQIVFSTDTIYAGYLYCGTPPLPMLENGKYRLEIASDSLAPNAFSATYVRE